MIRIPRPIVPSTLVRFKTLVAFNSKDANSNSDMNHNKLERPKRSAFGKAAIGKSKNITNALIVKESLLVDDNASQDTRLYDQGTYFSPKVSPVYHRRRDNHRSFQEEIDTTSYTENQISTSTTVEIRRQEAVDALRTHLCMSKKDSVAFLDTCPKLYTDIPHLSSKLTYLLDQINMKAKQLRKMIQVHPLLMETVFLDDQENIQSTVEILQSELDMSIQDIQKLESLSSLPAILNYPRSDLRKRILVYKLDLKLNTLQLKTLVFKDARILRTDSDNVRRILQVLQEELNINNVDVQVMLQKEILLCTYRAEENIRPTILYLKQNEIGKCLGMVHKGKTISSRSTSSTRSRLDALQQQQQQELIQDRLKSLIMRHPKILSSSVEKNLIPTVQFFLQYVGMTELEFGRLLYRRGGSMLEANIERSLKRKIDFFRHELELQVHHNSEHVLHNESYVTELLTPIPIPPVDEMASLTCIQKKRLLAQMLASNPDILTLSIESNLTPKFEYFTQTIGFTRAQLCHILLKRPQIVALSLERNIFAKMDVFMSPRRRIETVMLDEQCGLGLTKVELRHWITENPQVLTCTLETRIRPRIKDAVESDLYIGKNLPSNFITQSSRSWDAVMKRKRTTDVI